MNAGEDNDADIAYRWDLAEIRRMQRAEADVAAQRRRLARQRVRFILNRLVRR